MRDRMQSICPSGPALCLVLLSACASPVEGLWPPSPESGVRSIYVSLDTWHAVISLPVEREATSDPTGTPGFEEWGYAERAWYVEDKRGASGVLRALFWPTDGVVEVGRYDRVWAHRTPEPPSDLFVFRVNEESYRRLRLHLSTTLLSAQPTASFGQSTFYSARRSYHLFHTCHQYAAQALREAGLPVSPFWAFSRGSFAWQLEGVVRLQGNPQPTDLQADINSR